MDSGYHKLPYWSVTPDWPDSQRCQVKNDDMSSGGDPVGNVGGDDGASNYGERIYLPVNSVASSAVPGL